MTNIYFEEITDDEEGTETETEPNSNSNKQNDVPLPASALTVHQLPPCPHSIGGEASLTLIRNKAFIFGGCSREGVPSNNLSCFDFDSNDWICNPECQGNAPSPRFGHSAVAYDSKLYIFGGQCQTSSDSTTNTAEQHLESCSSLYYLDLECMEWHQVLQVQVDECNGDDSNHQASWPKSRNSQGAALSGSKWIIFGGANESIGPMGDFWWFDLEAMVWHEINIDVDFNASVNVNDTNDKPCAREMHTLCSDAENDCLYLLGGRKEDGGVCQDFWMYNFEQGLWIELDAPPSPRCAHTAVFLNQSRFIDVIGGWDGKGIIFDDCISYDAETGKWADASRTTCIVEEEGHGGFPSRLAHCSCLLSDGRVLIAGGVNAEKNFSDICVVERK